ncbi:hypothetical protein HRbin08_01920 [bacterium HR08]|nr:hypothetical protein HRbin08_01920 [bacterium HR08]
MFDALARGIRVVAQPRANPRHLIGGDRGADAAPADEDAALGSPLQEGVRDGFGVVGIVHRIRALGPQVFHIMPELAQMGDEHLLQLETGMIGSDDDAHVRPPQFWIRRKCTREASLGGRRAVVVYKGR